MIVIHQLNDESPETTDGDGVPHSYESYYIYGWMLTMLLLPRLLLMIGRTSLELKFPLAKLEQYLPPLDYPSLCR